MPGTEEGTPCGPCPWVSTDQRDKDTIEATGARAAMEQGKWFCCHVNMGTCHGARLQHEKHLRKAEMKTKIVTKKVACAHENCDEPIERGEAAARFEGETYHLECAQVRAGEKASA